MNDQEDKKDEPRAPDEAAALSFDPIRDRAPRLTAFGRGEDASEILRLAAQHQIPIKYDPDLVQVLSKLDVGQTVPEEVYLVVAEILAFIYWVNQEFFFTGPDGPEETG